MSISTINILGALSICLLAGQSLVALSERTSFLQAILNSHSLDTFAESSGYSCFQVVLEESLTQPTNDREYTGNQICAQPPANYSVCVWDNGDYNLPAYLHSTGTYGFGESYVPTRTTATSSNSLVDIIPEITHRGPVTVDVTNNPNQTVSFYESNDRIYHRVRNNIVGQEGLEVLPVTYTDTLTGATDQSLFAIDRRAEQFSFGTFDMHTVIAEVGESTATFVPYFDYDNLNIITAPTNGTITLDSTGNYLLFNATSPGVAQATVEATYTRNGQNNKTRFEIFTKSYTADQELVVPVQTEVLYTYGENLSSLDAVLGIHQYPYYDSPYVAPDSNQFGGDIRGDEYARQIIDYPYSVGDSTSGRAETVTLDLESTFQESEYITFARNSRDAGVSQTSAQITVVDREAEIEITNTTAQNEFYLDSDSQTISVPVSLSLEGLTSENVSVEFEIASDAGFAEVISGSNYTVQAQQSGTQVAHTFDDLAVGTYYWRAQVRDLSRPVECPQEAEYDPPVYIFSTVPNESGTGGTPITVIPAVEPEPEEPEIPGDLTPEPDLVSEESEPEPESEEVVSAGAPGLIRTGGQE